MKTLKWLRFSTPLTGSQVWLSLGLTFGFLFVWLYVFINFKPEEMITAVGAVNTYFLVFFLAIGGSFFSITKVTIYPALVVFTLGMLHPFWLVLFASAGMIIGDLVFYFMGSKVRCFFTQKMLKKSEKFTRYLNRQPKWLVGTILVSYIGFSPFPNNLLTASLALSGYPFRKVILPVIIGDFTVVLLITYLTRYGYSLW